ncbi:PREDICTED: uncharacterized protein LOC106817630 [Priapulus caudatus]|uniref:Uncharacterized protein LOC106817630 n=1 Tax=Priapulus caudatus TaxID=37621 RepID=A0ABM1F027_PRICU|nr:PREDICTED: uncharacterized protein LOC106817630 [Priapulus caudatus]
MDLNEAKNARKAAKAALTRLMTITRAFRNAGDVQEVEDVLPNLGAALERVTEAHDAYVNLLEPGVAFDRAVDYLPGGPGPITKTSLRALTLEQQRQRLEIRALKIEARRREQLIREQELELKGLQDELESVQRKAELTIQTGNLKQTLERREPAGVYHSTPQPTLRTPTLNPVGATPVPNYPETPRYTNDNRGLTPAGIARDTLSSEQSSFMQFAEQSRYQSQSLVDMIRLPTSRPPVFSGDPLKYWQFERHFSHAVDKPTVSSGDKLLRLLELTTGKANSAIAHFIYDSDHDKGFEDAKKCLRAKFGNNHHVSEAWIQKVLNKPNVTNDDQLQEMADDLRACLQTLTAMKSLDELSGSRCLLSIVEKLPRDMKGKWQNQNLRITETGRRPTFQDVVVFIEREAKKRADPVFGSLLSSKERTLAPAPRPSPNKAKLRQRQNFSTGVKAASTSTPTSTTLSRMPQCPQCTEDHYLNKCPGFRSMTVPLRTKFLTDHDRCFNCLGPGHHSQKCQRPWVCSAAGCGKKHNTWIHPPETAPPTPTLTPTSTANLSVKVGCNSTGPRTGRISLPIVPVVAKSVDGMRSTMAYALLDSGSTHSWCSEGLADTLGLRRSDGIIRLTTIDKKEESEKVSLVNLQIENLSGENRYNMYEVMIRPCLNVGLESLAINEQLSMWEHLKDISLPEINVSEVQLLIGGDLPDVDIPEEVIRGKEGEPFAVRTSLGWTIRGPVGQSDGARHVSSHCQTTTRDDQLQQQVEMLWRQDEPFIPTETAMSVNDRKVISLWEDTISQSGSHYSMGIPFKTRPPYLPDSRHRAETRLHSLARRLAKDPVLRTRYIAGIRDSIDKGYAEPVPSAEVDRKDGYVWYLPHHPVVNPRKPDKVRPVFDCAARCRGTSLNDQVHQGPDLNNKLIGVLLRFREEHVALMADIEGMFYQVRVHAADRDALRFLWWEEDDIDKPPTTYRMTSHLFGGVWSPSCASFALRRTAHDNSDKFDPETIATAEKNFYVDDCLKSVADEDELPSERVLGNTWRVDSDEFSFDVHVQEKPNTKRGLLSVTSSVYDPLGFASPFVLNAKRLFQTLCRLKKEASHEFNCQLKITSHNRHQ